MKEEEQDYQCPTNPLIKELHLSMYADALLVPENIEDFAKTEDLSESLVQIIENHLPQCQQCRGKLDSFLSISQLAKQIVGDKQEVERIKDIRRRYSKP